MIIKRLFLFTVLSFFCFLLPLKAQNWDINTLHDINSLDGKFARNYSKVISKSTLYLAAGIPLGIGAYALLNKKQPLLQDALFIGTSVAEAVVLSSGIKELVNRERPFDRYPDLIEQRDFPKSASFPSGHTAAAFSLATSLSLKYPKWYVIAPSALWACSVGFARMNQGVHYPSDVIGGAVIGFGCAVANIYINRWLNNFLFPTKEQKNFKTKEMNKI